MPGHEIGCNSLLLQHPVNCHRTSQNRGLRVGVPFNRYAPRLPTLPPTDEIDVGDGFIMRHGWTVAMCGWQWDIERQPGLMGLEAPQALDADSCDLILTTGGSGVGRTDATAAALAQRGELIAHGIALQPGRSAAIGRSVHRLVASDRVSTSDIERLTICEKAAFCIFWTFSRTRSKTMIVS